MGACSTSFREKNVRILPRDQSFQILMNNIDNFPPGPESKVKTFGLITLGEFSKQPNIDCELWLLVITVMRIYNEMEQVYQRKLQNKI